MKVIDLLNKIVNGEEVPNKISVKGKKFEYNNSYESIEQLYISEIGIDWLHEIDINLNTEIEIIEEPKKIEKLPEWATSREDKEYTNDEYHCIVVARKVDEIIDYINKDKQCK